MDNGKLVLSNPSKNEGKGDGSGRKVRVWSVYLWLSREEFKLMPYWQGDR